MMRRTSSSAVGRAAGLAAALLVSSAVIVPAYADNPIITTVYTADPAALVHDGTLYVYTGHDEAPPGGTNFVMRDWYVLSTADVETWTNHGPRLALADFAWAGADAWASHVVERDGTFYLYVSVNGNGPGWMDIGVATANSPLGPFTDAIGGPLISDSTPNSSPLNIDPTVFVDDDGQAYIYWGSFWGVRAARLNPDMVSLAGPVITPQGVTNFWEAPWLFKRNGTYYLAYAANDSGCVSSSSYACVRYATASNPMGPWTHRGVVLDQVSSTTNHPAITEYEGQWWMIYHTADAPGGGNFRRSVAVDPLYFNPDGTIQKVVQTVGGGSGQPPPGTNLALTATASTSYVSPWESLTAINDGFVPTSSADRSHPVYGNWPEQGTEWVEYAWPSAVTVDRVATYWFDDNMGIDLPSSCQVQYWTGSTYATVPGQSACGVTADTYNVTTLDAVTTTRLRLNVTSRPGFSTGILEWMALEADGGGLVNLALSASASCSYTSPWESCAAINTGGDPASSNIPGPNQGSRWGTWPQEDEQWAQLTWPSAVTLSRADVYFFDDNMGIDLPSSWRLQTWNGTTYVDVADPGGYPSLADQYNTVIFNEVSTTRLRVLLQSATDSVGLLEVRAYGPAP